MASPLRRAIQTAMIAFASALQNPDVPFLLVPQAQEISAKPCDVGFEQEELELEVPKLVGSNEVRFDVGRIDYSILERGWNSKVRHLRFPTLKK